MDAVITYVNGEDKTWREEYKKYVKYGIEESRFRDLGTLPHLIKGIKLFMPFIEHIYLVVSTPSQITGIDVSEVNVVYHKDIIPEKYLPTFNSCTIEMFLHKIPGLSEEFIYFNDDTFVIKPMKETDFFIDGKPVLNPHLQKCSQFDKNSVFVDQCKNSTELIRSKFVKKYPVNVFIRQEHIMRPMLKSTCKIVWETCETEIINSLTRIRTNRNYNVYLFNNYDVMTGWYVQKEVPYKYIKTSDSISSITSDITSDKFSVVCINDSGAVSKNDKAAINSAFENIIDKTEYKPVKQKPLVLKEDIIEQEPNMRVALCAIAKNENLYIREWVEWYKKLGISKIFLYDNNDIDGERFEDVISDYIKLGFVELIDRRGVVKTTKTDEDGQTLQGLSYQNCYESHYKEFDWICFFDIDEYLEINENYNLFTFLNMFDNEQYQAFDGIHVQWKMYGDNNLLYYDKRPVIDRFYSKQNVTSSSYVKTILKGKTHFKKNVLFCAHGPIQISGRYKQISIVNIDGSEAFNCYRNKHQLNPEMPAYLNHFYSKSTEEFITRKWQKTSAVTGVNKNRNYSIDFLKEQYFQHNKVTSAKMQLFNNLICYNKRVNKIDKNDKIIVNFTTWKKRDMYVPFLLKYFKNQTLLPDKIICWLSYDEYNGVIPDSIKYCLENDLLSEVHFVEGNTYGHKRYETFKYNNSAYNILIDDDIYYPIDYVELLYKECKENPNNVICYYSRHEIYEKNGKRSFTDLEITPSFVNRYFSGLAAFPPNLFPIESFKYSTLRDKYCKKCDDSWINGWLFRKNIKVKGIFNWGKKSPLNVIGNSQDDGIYETHNGLKINGIMQAAINIANAVTVTGTTKIANKIWPFFNISEVTTCDEVIL